MPGDNLKEYAVSLQLWRNSRKRKYGFSSGIAYIVTAFAKPCKQDLGGQSCKHRAMLGNHSILLLGIYHIEMIEFRLP